MPRENVQGLTGHLAVKHTDRLAEFLRYATVSFAVRDRVTETMKLIGSGVVADLFGAKVVLTAGHVIREYKRDFRNEDVYLSVNGSHGTLNVNLSATYFAPGETEGEDAGVVVLHPSDGSSYFNFAQFAPIGPSTINAAIASVGAERIVAGFPAFMSSSTIMETSTTTEKRLATDMCIIASYVVDVDGVHIWLDANGRPFGNVPREPLKPGLLAGMSGGGCWSVAFDREAKESFFSLNAVHTATQLPRLRETPIVHHLRILAKEVPAIRDRVTKQWLS